MKKIFVSYEKCIGCKHCELNCAVAHHPSKNLFAMVNDKKTQVNVKVVKIDEYTFPVSCRHCEPAYCMDACPSGAISRDKDSNAVVITSDLCKACAMCAMVCPFDAISFKETHESKFGRDVAYKCDLCVSNLAEDETPACVTACKTGALDFREFEDIRVDKAKEGLHKYLAGKDDIPANIKLYREFKKHNDSSVGE